MKQIPLQQSEFLIKNLIIDDRFWPTNFYEPKDFIDIFNGKSNFRGLDWPNDSLNFAEDIFLSLTDGDWLSGQHFEEVFDEINKFEQKCLHNEFYEILSNIKEIKECYNKALEWEQAEKEQQVLRANGFIFGSNDRLEISKISLTSIRAKREQNDRDLF